MTQPPGPSLIRLGVLNDHAIVVEGVAAIFRVLPAEFEVSVGLGTETLTTDQDGAPLDVVLLDPFASLVPLADRVPALEVRGETKYVVLTWHTSASSVAEAFESGCVGYLHKTMDADALRKAVKDIHQGQRIALPSVSATGDTPAGTWPGHQAGLTARESELLILIARGLTNAEIVARAHVGADSLKSHIRSAYRKIGATRRSQAIIWCLSHGLDGTAGDLAR